MNLLSVNEKNNLQKGLRFRYLVILNILVTASFLLGTAVLIPAYVLIRNDLSFATSNSSVKLVGETVVQDLLKVPNEIETKLKLIQSNLAEQRTVRSISLVVDLLPEKVSLESISFSRKNADKYKKGVVLSVFGIASDRESLVLFANALRDSKRFSSVDVPVSSLTKDKNLPFTINLFIAN